MNRFGSHSRIAVTCALALAAGSALGQLRVIPSVDLFCEDPTHGRLPSSRFGSVEEHQWQQEAQAALDESPHLLVFADWRQLHGRLVAVTPTEVIWWNKAAKEPLHFPLSEVRKISIEGLGDRDSSLPEGLRATLKLADTSRLSGELTTAKDGNFNLRLDMRSVLHIHRNQVQGVYFGMRRWPLTSFSGSALQLVEWLPRYDPPKIVADTVVVLKAGWTGFHVELPKRFELDFELPEESEEGTRLWLQPYGTQEEVFGPETTMVRFGKEEIMWQNYSEEPVQKPVAGSEKNGPVSYRVFCDQDDRHVTVLRNGKQVADWIFSKTHLDRGMREICFHHENLEGNTTLKIQRPRLQPWTGIVPGFNDGDERDQFASGKSEPTPGKLESITNTEFVFSGQPHHIEPETILRLSGAPAALPKPTARVKLVSWDDMNVRNLDIHDSILRCDTAFAGKVEVRVDNIYALFFDPAHSSREPKDILVFRNGDEIAGHLLAAEANAPVRWKLLSGQKAVIEAQRVAGIRFAAKSRPQPPGATASIILRNGDLLHGDLVALDGKKAQFQHPVLGALHLDRGRIWQAFPNRSLQPTESSDPSWSRGLSPEDSLPLRNEEASFDRWIHVDGTYVVRNCEREDDGDQRTWPGLSRDIPVGMERFEVRAYATSDRSSVTTVLFRLSSPDSRTDWRASLHQNILQVNVRGPRIQQPGWRTTTIENDAEESATCRLVRIFVDLQAGTSDFYVNGTFVERLGRQLNERLVPGHYTAHIQPDPYESAPRVISNLWILPWSGELPQGGQVPRPRTFLKNGDILPGAATSLRDGKFAVESEAGPLEVSVEDIAEVDFAGAPAPEQAPRRLRLADGSFINVDRFHWAGRFVVAHSGNLGDLHIPTDAVSELVYGPKPVMNPATVIKPPAADVHRPHAVGAGVIP